MYIKHKINWSSLTATIEGQQELIVVAQMQGRSQYSLSFGQDKNIFLDSLILLIVPHFVLHSGPLGWVGSPTWKALATPLLYS